MVLTGEKIHTTMGSNREPIEKYAQLTFENDAKPIQWNKDSHL